MDKLGEILIDMGALSENQLEEVLETARQKGKVLGKSLLEDGIISEETLLKALSRQMGIPYVDNLAKAAIDGEVIKTVPVKLVWHYKFMPISIEGSKLVIAVSDPLDVSVVEDIKLLLGMNSDIVLAPKVDILQAISRYYGVGAETVQKILEQKKAAEPSRMKELNEGIEDLDAASEEASVVKLVEQIFRQAIDANATDLHFENYRDKISIRCRVDGVLSELALPKDIRILYPAIVSRIKIISGLDVVEKRLPQDGRVKLNFHGSSIDMRVSVIPSTHGENVVIRLLPTEMIYDIEKLGFQKDDKQKIQDIIHLPVGIIFLAGPTGSGKTTTLYTSLQEIKTPKTKIITIEDPVEYELDGIMQIQVAPKIGLDFASCLRSVLRHDPDIMMVGEVRDSETAELAVRSALTGHLIFSTIHTNDATSGVARLLDMNIEPFLLTSAVKAIIGQRLVRVICEQCKKEQPVGDVLKKQNIPVQKHFRGDGCDSCRHTGYKGRTAVYEIFILDEEIKEMILTRVSSTAIRKKAREKGMHTMREDGWLKVEQGVTTIEEILRVTEQEND